MVRGSACLGLLAMSNPDFSGLFSPATDLVVPCRHDAGASGRYHCILTELTCLPAEAASRRICEAREVDSLLTFGWALAFCEKEPSPKMARQTPHVPKALGCVSLLQHAANSYSIRLPQSNRYS